MVEVDRVVKVMICPEPAIDKRGPDVAKVKLGPVVVDWVNIVVVAGAAVR
jgi:hypothetical protein